jgi:hypothetical protein
VRSGVSARVPLGTIPGVDEERFLNSKQLLGPRHRLRRVRRSICPPGSHPFVTESAALAPAPAREARCLRRWAVDGDFFLPSLLPPRSLSLSLLFSSNMPGRLLSCLKHKCKKNLIISCQLSLFLLKQSCPYTVKLC